MDRASRQNTRPARAIAVDLGEFRQLAFLAVALVLEFTTMLAG